MRTLHSFKAIKYYPEIIRVVGITLIVSLMTSALGATYHAGYVHGWAKWGVSARIYTIDPSVGASALAEWDSVIISWIYGYYVQLGYRKRWGYGTDFYREKRDSDGYNKKILGSVTPYTWHTYKIVTDGYGVWRCYIDGVNKGAYTTDPEEPQNLKAMVETKSTSIEIDGSSFLSISYYNVGNGRWYLWNDHYEEEDPPYTVTEQSHFSFLASGGG
jgi:hypothetical protein